MCETKTITAYFSKNLLVAPSFRTYRDHKEKTVGHQSKNESQISEKTGTDTIAWKANAII